VPSGSVSDSHRTPCHRLTGDSTLSLRLELPLPVRRRLNLRLASKLRSAGGASDQLPTLRQTLLVRLSVETVSGLRRILLLSVVPACDSPACARKSLPSAPAASFRLAPYVLAPRPSWRFSSWLAPQTVSSGCAADASFGLRRWLHRLTCQRSRVGLRRNPRSFSSPASSGPGLRRILPLPVRLRPRSSACASNPSLLADQRS